MGFTLVTFHAHPDDEALLTAGTMAKAAEAGHRVVLVVATSGEVGDADRDLLASDESLGNRRRRETMASAEALGVARVEFLGYGDSGIEGDRAAPGTRPFATAPLDEAAQDLAALLREERADVLTTYDANGGYGHADHKRVHEVGARAADLASTPALLEATVNRDALRMGVEIATGLGYEIPMEFDPGRIAEWFSPGEAVTHTVDVREQLASKRASMAAHATQTTSAESTTRTLARILELPADLFSLAFGTEWFIERGRSPRDPTDDVFATVTRLAGTG